MRRLTDFLKELWLRAVAVPVLLFLAERDLRRGLLHSARVRFLRAARLAPASFRAHFGLARVYLGSRDIGLARRELVIANALAPARFSEVRGQLPEPFRDEDHMSPRPAFRIVGVGDAEPDTRFGDCLDMAEWRRFRTMGPISSEELDGLDWDGVLQRLEGGGD